MLSVLEDRLLTALQAALPDSVRMAAGPSHLPTSSREDEVVIVAAYGVDVQLGATDADLESARGPSYLTSIQRWSADGAVRDFTLPEGVEGEIVEVESPPGRQLKQGDDYFVEGRAIKFYKPPAQSDDAVVATIHANIALGFQEKRDCKGTLEVAAWAKDMQHADELLRNSLSAVLPLLVEIGTLERDDQNDLTSRIRLLKVVAALTSIERSTELVEQTDFFKATANFTLQGQLEVTVAFGEPEPEGLIEQIQYELDRPTTRPTTG